MAAVRVAGLPFPLVTAPKLRGLAARPACRDATNCEQNGLWFADYFHHTLFTLNCESVVLSLECFRKNGRRDP
jgi:hypothetical protein